MIKIGGILVLFIYITRLASNKIFSLSNKIHWEVGQAKDLSAPLYIHEPESTKITKEHLAPLIFSLHTPSLVHHHYY